MIIDRDPGDETDRERAALPRPDPAIARGVAEILALVGSTGALSQAAMDRLAEMQVHQRQHHQQGIAHGSARHA